LTPSTPGSPRSWRPSANAGTASTRPRPADTGPAR
jgi:hypothetical protein